MSEPPARATLWQYLAAQRAGIHVRLLLAQLALRVIPEGVFAHVRPVVYRWAGFAIGPRVRMLGRLSVRGWGDVYGHLSIGAGTGLNAPVFLDLSAPIRIGTHCTIGHHVVFITTNHAIGPASRRGGAPSAAGITVNDGAWIGACTTILPGVTIGAGAFIAAGSVVTRNIPPNARARGNPAKLLGFMRDTPASAAAPAIAPEPSDAR